VITEATDFLAGLVDATGWRAIKLKHLCHGGPVYGANIPADTYTSEGIRFIRTTDIGDMGNLSPEGVSVPENLPEERLIDGDLLLSRSGTIGRSFLYDFETHGPCFYAGYLVRFRPINRATSRFLFWASKSAPFLARLASDAIESTISNFNGQKYANIYILTPVDTKRRAYIADFLDRETAKIDALIGKQTEFLTLLEEHRRALVTEAVTKGLDPAVPVNETGIPTLPRCPAHWSVKRLKHVAPDITVGVVVTPAKYYAESGIPALRSFNVKEMEVTHNDLAWFSEESNKLLAKSILHAGDVVAVRTGKPGTTAVVPPEFEGANCIDLIIIRQSNRFHSRFLAYFMNSDVAHTQYAEGSEGALQQHFSIETAKNLILPVPPVREQATIARSLDATLEKLQTLRSACLESLSCLRERRSALITAAVTGQIDVTQASAVPEAA
jgi:type I restriction enzyme S subunit